MGRLASALVAANLLWYGSYAYQYVFFTIMGRPPLYAYLVTIAGSLMVFILGGMRFSSAKPMWWLLVWAAAFTSAMSFSFLFINNDEAALQAVITDGESIALMVSLLFLLREREAVNAGQLAMVVVLIVAITINWLEFLRPGMHQFSTVPGRAAGMYRNPNICGNILVLGMILSVWKIPKALRLLFCLAVGSAVAITFSRSSIMAWAIATTGLAWYRAFLLPRFVSVGLVVGTIVIGAVTLISGQWISMFESLGIGDRLDKNTHDRISSNFVEQGDHSSRERRAVAERALQLYLEAPIAGHGIGSTTGSEITRVGAHNTYLKYGAELGTLGILLVVALSVITWTAGTPEARITSVTYAISCIFSHNNIDQPVVLMLMALSVASGFPREEPRIRLAESGQRTVFERIQN